MSKELVIGSNRHETKVAILEEDQLVEVYFQRGQEYALAGSIHKGRVTRVLPGMQSAFVDLGLERDTFLYVSDFFEEHGEDIDTVKDDRPISRGDGRGDGRRDRGQNRPRERAPEERVPEAIEAAPGDTNAPPAEIGAGPEQAGAPRPPEQFRAAERQEGDRGPRGDRRGRRSRRRRPQGRDFPESKYAQPGVQHGPQSGSRIGPPPETEAPRPVFHSAEPVTEEASDVIVLPGESLAKYRSRPEQSNEPRFDPAESHEEAEPHEHLVAEAEELEMADRIFSHRDDDSVEAEEEKLESVEQDHAEDSPGVHSPAAVEPVEVDPIDVNRMDATPIYRGEQEFSGELTVNATAEADELELEEAEETLPAVEDLAPEIEEALENAAGGEVVPPDADAEVAPTQQPPEDDTPAVQTAMVRDQNNRSMHRVSRRMRRRRGGSRFGGPSQAGGGGATVAGGTGSAAVPALEPQARGESPREAVEEHSVERPERVMPSISELLKPGQEIIVQIAKEPLGQKGARITSHIALPGRYVVFMPSVEHLGVSRKVASDEERHRLKRILQTHRVGTTGGFIVRTAGEGVPEEEIAADMNFLYGLWLDIRQKAEKKPAPALLHYDLDLVQRILRDHVTDEFKAIWVDNEDLYENVLTFMQRFQPALVNRVKMYTRTAPVFDAFGITQELEKALRPKVWLKSGGYIVINQTEALVAIDINTGKYVGKSNRLEDTIVKTNIEAVKEIVRQIRLRDLGGIIVVDFIDMDERKNRQKVMQALEEAMRADKAPNKILQFNDFGLVAITRKRVKQSLERTLCAPCPHCEGAGYIKSVQTVVGEILIEAQKLAKAIEGKDVMLRVHPDVAKVLKASSNKYLEELEEILGRPVLVTGDAALHHEKFDLG
jgi:ribonuclease G